MANLELSTNRFPYPEGADKEKLKMVAVKDTLGDGVAPEGGYLSVGDLENGIKSDLNERITELNDEFKALGLSVVNGRLCITY